MIKSTKIKCFLYVARLLSFTEASKQLFISQQAVSKHVSDLEKDIGLRLFARDHHHVALTPEGERVFEYLSEANDSWERLMKDIQSHGPRNKIQSIRIGYQNWMNFDTAPSRALKALKPRYPDLNLIGERHSPAGLLDLLGKGALDIVLIHKRFMPKKSELIVLPLFDTPMQVVVSEEHMLNGENTKYDAFRNEPLLMDRLEGETDENAIRRALKEAKTYGFTPSAVIVLPNRDSIYTEAELNRGIFFGSGMTQMPVGMRLIKYDMGIADTICCVRRKENRKNRVRDFAEQLQTEYTEDKVGDAGT